MHFQVGNSIQMFGRCSLLGCREGLRSGYQYKGVDKGVFFFADLTQEVSRLLLVVASTDAPMKNVFQQGLQC